MSLLKGQTGRIELKFATSAIHKNQLESWLTEHAAGFRRSYPTRQINNVYFDGNELPAYFHSHEGQSDRTKVRYRWYGERDLPGPGQLEVKLRRNHLGSKEAYPTLDFECRSLVWNVVIEDLRGHLPPEGRHWLDIYERPILINRYVRDYWESWEGDLRITLDYKQRIYGQPLGRVNVHRRAETEDTMILEVKGARDMAKLIGSLVAEIPVRRSRHSKYCSAVESIV